MTRIKFYTCVLALAAALCGVSLPSHAFDIGTLIMQPHDNVSDTTVDNILVNEADSLFSSTTMVLNEGAKSTAKAHLRVLDKQINRLEQVTLSLSSPFVVFDSISIDLKRCIKDYQQEGQDIAFLVVNQLEAKANNSSTNISASHIQKTRTGQESNNLFAGWMVNSRPQVATLEHPRYDVALLACVEE